MMHLLEEIVAFYRADTVEEKPRRPGLQQALAAVPQGDTLVVPVRTRTPR